MWSPELCPRQIPPCLAGAVLGLEQGRSQDLVSGGGTHFGGGGATPYFSPQTPNHKGPPLCTFGYLRISGGGAPPAPLTMPLGWNNSHSESISESECHADANLPTHRHVPVSRTYSKGGEGVRLG